MTRRAYSARRGFLNDYPRVMALTPASLLMFENLFYFRQPNPNSQRLYSEKQK